MAEDHLDLLSWLDAVCWENAEATGDGWATVHDPNAGVRIGRYLTGQDG